MDRDEEKDLYIKAKLKDGHIPEKIDDLFNNSAKLVEDIEPAKKNKKQVIFQRISAIAACAIIALGGGNIYATTQGYDNVFFMIKEWVAPLVDVQGKDEILSDRDITISYKSIEIAKGIKLQINRLVIKDDEARLHLKVDQSETELDITPFTYIVRDQKGKEICNYTSTNKGLIYNEELKLEGLTKKAKKLELEIKPKDESTLVKLEINLENKEIQIIGNENELEKISEEELKKYLGAFALLNYEDDILNAATVDKDALENARKMLVARQLSKELDLDFYLHENTEKAINNVIDVTKANSLISSFSDIELEQDGLMKLDNIYFIESTENGQKVYLEMIEKQTSFGINSLCIDVTDIMYSNGIYTVTFTYSYPTTEDINEDRIEDLPLYEMTIGLTINEEQTYSKYRVSSKMESILIEGATSKEDYFILYQGLEMEKKTGVQDISDMKISMEASKKYNTTYYNYENGKYLGITEGTFGEETYEGCSIVDNVKTIAISEKYNAIPRQYETISELPKALEDMADCTTVDIQAIDLEGNGTKEHIVCYTVSYKAGEIGDGEPVASSGIMLFDENYKKICDLVTYEKTEENKIFMSLDDVEYIDIDNDGIMEIIIRVPVYEGTSISVIKYNNGTVEGETNIKVNIDA